MGGKDFVEDRDENGNRAEMNEEKEVKDTVPSEDSIVQIKMRVKSVLFRRS